MTSSIFPMSSPVLVRTRLRRIVVPSHNLRLCMIHPSKIGICNCPATGIRLLRLSFGIRLEEGPMKKFLSAIVLGSTLAAAAPAQTPAAPQPPMLVVMGNGQVMATPDEATVRLGIVRQAPAAQAAQDQASAVTQQILNEIRKLGVMPERIQTARLVLSPVYAPRSPESRDAPRIVAYNASNTVTVRLDDLSLVGPVIDAG